jgi:hypothetical protein
MRVLIVAAMLIRRTDSEHRHKSPIFPELLGRVPVLGFVGFGSFCSVMGPVAAGRLERAARDG